MRTIHKEVAAWLCLELSSDGQSVFIGGSEHLSLTTGDGFLFSLDFSSKADISGFKRFSG